MVDFRDAAHSLSPHALRQVAMEAARLAGAELLRRWRGPLGTRSKGLRDIVTDADVAAERIVIETIHGYYPDHAILSEEGGAADCEADSEYQWIIDPLDGTTNYARGLPYFSVAIAAARAGRPVAAAVYDPLRDAMYHAATGAGAFCNERRLECSVRRRLIDLLLTFDWPRQEAPRAAMTRLVQTLSPQVGGLRTFGSAALELCSVAEGASDGYLHLTLHAWDIAAPGLVIEEAGGCITGIDGSSPWWQAETCLATNPLIHDDLLVLVGPALANAP